MPSPWLGKMVPNVFNHNWHEVEFVQQHYLLIQQREFHVKDADFHLLGVFVDSFCDGDVRRSRTPTKVLGCGFSRDPLFCFEPAVNLHSHPLETTGTLVDDAEVAVAVVAKGRRRVAQAVGVADSILELVDLGDLGLEFPLEMV